jgi:dTDP-4-dehydrorhamnose 3,5-epimerase
MRFEETRISGVTLITPDLFADERGFFARTWGLDVFEANGIDARVVQRNLSYNRHAGTLRGMHYQLPPHGEAKLVSCLTGRVFDVAIDLRSDSPTFGKWFGAELSAGTGVMLYIPKGCAHGYQALEPESNVEYLITEFYHPESVAGVRWNDPSFGVRWPVEPTVMNERDRSWPDFEPARAELRSTT